ncbi:MAG TPA: hypothetical protein ENJ60_11670 [Aeromonadales bacterium]|nr:hypothetical protein [Aeromonadales bacterium]
MKYTLLMLLFLSTSIFADIKYNISGRGEYDYSYYQDGVTRFDSGGSLRRLRLGAFISFNEYFSSYIQSDVANYNNTHEAATQAAWLRFGFDKSNQIYLGKMEMPFSLESVSNSKYHFFMERSLSSGLTERFGTGITYVHTAKDWNFRLGAFGNDIGNFGKLDDFGRTNIYGWAITGRIGKKIKLDNAKLFLGVSAQYRDPATSVRFRSLPESNTFRARLIGTRRLTNIDYVNKFGGELLWKNLNWSVQTEYIRSGLNNVGSSNTSFDGGYVIISRIFNGKRRFNYKKGEWMSTRVTPWETWEISARYSFLDLQTADIKAGKEKNTSLGINYYPTKNSRIMINYIHAAANPDRNGINENLDIVQMRFQLEF